MNEPGTLKKIFSYAPVLARLGSLLLVGYWLVMTTIVGWNLPLVLFSGTGLFVTSAMAFLLILDSVTHFIFAERRGRAQTLYLLARAFLWIGIALCLGGVPRSLAHRETRVYVAGEGEIKPQEAKEGLPDVEYGAVQLASKGSHVILSKQVDIAAAAQTTISRKEMTVGLFPPEKLGLWRLTVNKFGYAPYLKWWGPDGAALMDSWIMLGTFNPPPDKQHLVQWAPKPNLMLGVGYYPPDIEDLIVLPGSPYSLFVRMSEATIGGVRRNLLDPDAHRFMSDGRPENPEYFVQAFYGPDKIYEGVLKPGETAEFEDGKVILSSNVLLWVEVQAVKDLWIYVVFAGAIMMIAGAFLYIPALFFSIAAGISKRRVAQ